MHDKREIGKKIWELFSKNYTYGEIAKELGISKSVVSNVINYSLPSKDWAQEDIKKIKEECEKSWEEEVNELEEEHKIELKEIGLGLSMVSGATTGMISIVILFIVYYFNIPMPSSKFTLLATILGIGTILGLISFFITKFIFNKVLEETQ